MPAQELWPPGRRCNAPCSVETSAPFVAWSVLVETSQSSQAGVCWQARFPLPL
jgi:hypothetical protein